MKTVDLLLYNASQVITCAASDGPKRGKRMQEIEIVEDGGVAVLEGRIVGVGTSIEMESNYTATRPIDCSGKAICPGFVDPHTHVVYGGDRAGEFELRHHGGRRRNRQYRAPHT